MMKSALSCNSKHLQARGAKQKELRLSPQHQGGGRGRRGKLEDQRAWGVCSSVRGQQYS